MINTSLSPEATLGLTHAHVVPVSLIIGIIGIFDVSRRTS